MIEDPNGPIERLGAGLYREGPHIYERINPIKHGKSKALGEGKSVRFVSSATARSKLKLSLVEKRKAKAALEGTQAGGQDLDDEEAGQADDECDGENEEGVDRTDHQGNAEDKEKASKADDEDNAGAGEAEMVEEVEVDHRHVSEMDNITDVEDYLEKHTSWSKAKGKKDSDGNKAKAKAKAKVKKS